MAMTISEKIISAHCNRSTITAGELIVRRDGDQLRRMHALALIYVLREADGIRQFRITQPALDRLDVDVVPDDAFTPETERTIEAGLRLRMGDDVDIRIRRRPRIAPTASGKHACVVSHV